ncbi:MAG: winged-helix phosphate transcriptional response regulator, partial [Nitrospirae bacterium]|nr:winged-helix phosphate transcriptional response regulator [Nitrospirota bacterium]
NSGSIVFASSNAATDRLGDFLLKTGALSEDQYLKSAKQLEGTRKRKAMILVEMGYLSPEELISAIRQHITEIILSLFEWEEGHFKFKNSPPCEEVITLDTPVSDLISAGSLRIEREKSSGFNKEINELIGKMNSLTHYELLEVSVDASSDELKKAYLQKVKKYHPDKHNPMLNHALSEHLSNLLSALNYAYNTLKDEKSRAEYDNSISKIKKSKKVPDPNIILAKGHFNKGINDFSKGNFWGASDSFRMATRMQPRESIYWAHLSLALSKMPKRTKEAEETMLKAISLDPNNSYYHMNLGLILLNSGMKLRAIREFENALKLDPDNKKASIELEKLKLKK